MDKQDIMKIYSNYVDTKRRITITGSSDFYEYNMLGIIYSAGVFAGAAISFLGFTIGHKQGVKNYELALYNKIIEETINATTK